jgi:hypothetical protein
MTSAVAALRRQLEELVPTPPVESRGLGTGIVGLDALLPMRGLPRGKLTEIRGQKGSGITTVIRHIVAEASQTRLVAYVDASRTLAAVDFVGNEGSAGRNRKGGARRRGTDNRSLNQDRAALPVADARIPNPDHLWVIRPPVAADSHWCTDVLLRSGAFALVVLDRAPPLSRSTSARLIRLARETGTALVVAGEEGRGSGVTGAAVRIGIGKREVAGIGAFYSGKRERGNGKRNGGTRESGVGRESGAPRRASRIPPGRSIPDSRVRIPERLIITIEKGGIRRGIEVEYAIGLEDRLCAYPAVGDRRGAPSGMGSRDGRTAGIGDSGSGIGTAGIGDSGLGIGTAGIGDSGSGIGAESEFGSGQIGKRGSGKGKAAPESRSAGCAALAPAIPSPIPHSPTSIPQSPLGPTPDRPGLRCGPRQAGVAGGDAGGDPRGDDGDGGSRVMRRARGAAVG